MVKRFGVKPVEIHTILAAMASNEEREGHLKNNLPHLYIACLSAMNRNDEREQFLQFCKDSYIFYTVYIEEVLEPYFRRLNGQEGKNFKHHFTLVNDRGEENHYECHRMGLQGVG